MNSFYLGIDIGGTNIRIILYKKGKNVIPDVKKIRFRRLDEPKNEINYNLCKLIDDYIKENNLNYEDLKGIGLSIAALFNRRTGDIIIWPNNKQWNKFPLKKYLQEKYKVPIIMEDDANSAALGEYLMGAGKGNKNLVYLTISTGIGCGIILNNSLYIGDNGWAGEVGHINVIEDGLKCTCGKRGCLQALASGPAILNKYTNDKAHNKEDDLREIVRRANNGDAVARRIFFQAGKYIGKMITDIIMLLDISHIILGGGVINAGDILLKPIKNNVKENISHFNRDIKIINAKLGDNSGVIGALSLIYSYVNDGKIISV